jgi:dTDP-glucose 4,6-dehydratase
MAKDMGKVLVTGAGGFIGSHLAELLVRRGYAVKAFVRYNSADQWGWLEQSPLAGEMEVVRGDIRDADTVERVLAGCSTVYHLAALVGIPYSYHAPRSYVATNVTGTVNVLQGALRHGVIRVMITSTCEVYGTARYTPMDEDHPLAAQSPYAATKIAADQLALSYHRSFGLPVTIVRPFNAFGPRQSARAVIPTIITQLLDSGRPVRLGNLTPTRDYTYVTDTVRGFVAIGEAAGFTGEVVHIGRGEEVGVGELASIIGRLMGVEAEIHCEEERVRAAASEVDRSVGDNSRLVKGTGWQPEYSLEAGLAAAIDWLRNHAARYRSENYTI